MTTKQKVDGLYLLYLDTFEELERYDYQSFDSLEELKGILANDGVEEYSIRDLQDVLYDLYRDRDIRDYNLTPVLIQITNK